SSRRRHTRWPRDWSSDVCSSDLFSRQKVSGAAIDRCENAQVVRVTGRRAEINVANAAQNDQRGESQRLTHLQRAIDLRVQLRLRRHGLAEPDNAGEVVLACPVAQIEWGAVLLLVITEISKISRYLRKQRNGELDRFKIPVHRHHRLIGQVVIENCAIRVVLLIDEDSAVSSQL